MIRTACDRFNSYRTFMVDAQVTNCAFSSSQKAKTISQKLWSSWWKTNCTKRTLSPNYP